jgi:hypothetical protein
MPRGDRLIAQQSAGATTTTLLNHRSEETNDTAW